MSSSSLNEMVAPSMERKPSADDSDNNMDYMEMIRPQERPNFESSENWSNFGMLSNSYSRNRSVSQLETSQGGLPPWLLSPDGTKQSVSWLPTGFNPDASLPNLDIDAPTAVTIDENDVVDDDDSRRELRGGQKMEKSEDGAAGDDQLLERLKKLGISEFISTNGEDDDIPDDLSDLSNGNASYIMDLAHQKENREKLLKEECLESALALYKRASRDGHAGQEVFLTILSHVQKRKRISKQKFYKLQDQRLEDALQDELKLRDSQDAEDDNSITIGDELESIAESSKKENQESEWHESEYDWGDVGGNNSGDLGPSNDTDKKKRSSKKKKRTSSKSRDSKTRPSKSKSDMTSERRKGDWRSLSVGSLSTSDHGNSSDHGDTKFQFLRRSLNDLEAVQEEPTPGKTKKKTTSSKKDKKASSTEDPLKKSKSKKSSKKKKSNSMTPSERTVESTAASSGLSEDMEISESPPLLKREVFVVDAAKASPTKTKKKKSVKSSKSSDEMEVTKCPSESADDLDAVMKSPKTSKRKKSASKKATKSDSLTMKSPTSPKKKRVASKKALSEPSLVSPPPESPKKKKSTKKSSTTSKSEKSGELTQEAENKPLAKAPESPSKPASSTTATTSTSASSKKANPKKSASIAGIVTSMFGHKKSSKESKNTDDKKRRGILSRFKSRSSDNVLDPKDRLLPIPGSQLQ